MCKSYRNVVAVEVRNADALRAHPHGYLRRSRAAGRPTASLRLGQMSRGMHSVTLNLLLTRAHACCSTSGGHTTGSVLARPHAAATNGGQHGPHSGPRAAGVLPQLEHLAPHVCFNVVLLQTTLRQRLLRRQDAARGGNSGCPRTVDGCSHSDRCARATSARVHGCFGVSSAVRK